MKTFILMLVAAGALLAAPPQTPERKEKERILAAIAPLQTREAQIARSQDGLLIHRWQEADGSMLYVQIKNITASQLIFDYHQLRAVQLDTGVIVQAGNVHFLPREDASYVIPPGKACSFKVEFSGGRVIAALSWAECEKWTAITGEVFDTPAAAVSEIRKALVRTHRTAKEINKLDPFRQ
jgi:hypothetical protein